MWISSLMRARLRVRSPFVLQSKGNFSFVSFDYVSCLFLPLLIKAPLNFLGLDYMHDLIHFKNCLMLIWFWLLFLGILWDMFVVIDLVHHLKKWNYSDSSHYEFIASNLVSNLFHKYLLCLFLSLFEMTTRNFLNYD